MISDKIGGEDIRKKQGYLMCQDLTEKKIQVTTTT